MAHCSAQPLDTHLHRHMPLPCLLSPLLPPYAHTVLTLNTGLSMAHCSAQPLDTHSLEFMVRLGGRLNASSTIRATAGMRVLDPTISTLLMSSGLRPASASACGEGEGNHEI